MHNKGINHSLKIYCDYCGNEKYKYKSHIEEHNFCNRRCYSLWKSINTTGKKNHMYGKHLSEEHKKKLSESKKKNPTRYWLGKIRTEETKEKLRKANLGKHHTKETKQKISFRNKGKIPSEETRRKMSAWQIGKKLSEETKIKISENAKTNPNYSMGGKHHTRETKEKLRLSHLGEKGSNWMGGISFEPYSVDWKKTLKRSIRERDRYSCRVCGKQQGEITFHVHHIDYNKKNCEPNNLITLCNKCHSITNSNRTYWEYFLKNMIVLQRNSNNLGRKQLLAEPIIKTKPKVICC